jgi:ankyrin repeat protein
MEPDTTTEILEAIQGSDYSKLKTLAGLPIERLDDTLAGGYWALHHAAGLGDPEVVRIVLGAPWGKPLLNAFDDISFTPLIHAVWAGHIEVVRLLLGVGADVNAHDESKAGNTAIHEAARNGTREMISLLLGAGADPEIRGWMQINAVYISQDRYEKDPTEQNKVISDMLAAAARK